MRAALTLILLLATQAQAATLCTLVGDARQARTLYATGECSTRVTPASTFKLPLAVMGFDSGVLRDAQHPVFEHRPGEPDWGGAAWLQPTDPQRWITYSVVWYSQRITHALGQARVEERLRAYGFGNADLRGDAGQNNGLERGWIASSLQVSPREQLAFIDKLATVTLPASPRAQALTAQLARLPQTIDGWEIHGKTGAAYPRDAHGGFDEAHGYGWFVGWASKGERVLSIVRLIQDDSPHPTTPGVRARDALLAEWPALLAKLPNAAQ
ncbi:MAG: Beta-lactamase OXA-18 [Pseudomonas citronellolis]|nr:MAG: Beta-lactamase OXA-18 [Pseudomonas citronellolis]